VEGAHTARPVRTSRDQALALLARTWIRVMRFNRESRADVASTRDDCSMATDRRDSRRELRVKGRQTQDTIRRFLLEWDAIGADVPDDEYDCMMGPLYGLVSREATTAVIATWLAEYRRDHFGLPADPDADAVLAERLGLAFGHP
jgi:hypothetical protein